MEKTITELERHEKPKRLIRHNYRRQVVNGTAYWLCSYKAAGRTQCACERIREDAVMSAFIRMSNKLTQNREELIGSLIHQLEKLQSRTTFGEKWVCKGCGVVIKISDDAFLSAITECINTLIAKPSIMQSDPIPDEPPVELIRLKNEIGRLLDSPAIEKEPLKNRIFEYASLVYEHLDTTERITEMIRATLQRTRPLSCYNGELTAKIATAIMLHTDKTVSLTLKNGQKIGKEKTDAGSSITETGAHHRPDYTACECVQRTEHYQAGIRLLPGVHQTGRTAQQL